MLESSHKTIYNQRGCELKGKGPREERSCLSFSFKNMRDIVRLFLENHNFWKDLKNLCAVKDFVRAK